MSPARQQPRRAGRCHVLGALLLCLLVAGWGMPPAVAGARPVLLVSDTDSSSHQAIVEHLRAAIGGGPGQGAAAVVAGLDTRQLDEGIPVDLAPGLIVTIGSKAAAAVEGRANGVPVLNVFLPHAAYRQLHASHGPGSAAIVLDQPLRRQLAVARALLPDARRAGMLRGPAGQHEEGALSRDGGIFGLDLDVVRIGPDDDPAAAIERVLGANDVVIATFDPEAYTPANAKWLLYLAFQQRRPIVGFSYALLKAGALAAVFSTPEQIAAQAADLVGDWLRSGVPPGGVVPPRYYHIGLNAPVARKLGIPVQSEAELQRQVRGLLGESS